MPRREQVRHPCVRIAHNPADFRKEDTKPTTWPESCARSDRRARKASQADQSHRCGRPKPLGPCRLSETGGPGLERLVGPLTSSPCIDESGGCACFRLLVRDPTDRSRVLVRFPGQPLRRSKADGGSVSASRSAVARLQRLPRAHSNSPHRARLSSGAFGRILRRHGVWPTNRPSSSGTVTRFPMRPGDLVRPQPWIPACSRTTHWTDQSSRRLAALRAASSSSKVMVSAVNSGSRRTSSGCLSSLPATLIVAR